MKVTGPLKEPVLDPCPNRDDLQVLVDDTCAPAVCTRPRGGVDPGVDCCQFWTAPDTWQSANIRVDHIDPEKFKYDQYRYQLYAKPADFDCQQGIAKLERVPDREYFPPVTDIRALRQTTTVPILPGGASNVPVVPSNPSGVAEVTFPMTQATMGQPDVTTACCVPVVPCQQAFKNMTSRVRPDTRCHQPPPPGRPMQQLGPQVADPCVDTGECNRKKQVMDSHRQLQQRGQGSVPGSCQKPGCVSNCGPEPPQYIPAPGNKQADPNVGLPSVFPPNQQAYSAPYVPQLQLPNVEFKRESVDPQGQGQAQGQGQCFDAGSYCVSTGIEDGLNPRGGADTSCTNVSTFRYQDRVFREYNSVKETPQERRQRLSRMSGAYGAALQPKQSGKRFLAGPKDNIVSQGNGFSWGGYPKHENRLCYVLERNHRC